MPISLHDLFWVNLSLGLKYADASPCLAIMSAEVTHCPFTPPRTSHGDPRRLTSSCSWSSRTSSSAMAAAPLPHTP